MPPTYHAKMDLWQYFGMIFEFPEITWGSEGGHLEDQFDHF